MYNKFRKRTEFLLMLGLNFNNVFQKKSNRRWTLATLPLPVR